MLRLIGFAYFDCIIDKYQNWCINCLACWHLCCIIRLHVTLSVIRVELLFTCPYYRYVWYKSASFGSWLLTDTGSKVTGALLCYI